MDGRLRPGPVIGRAFTIWCRGLPLFAGLVLVVEAPRILVSEYLVDALRRRSEGGLEATLPFLALAKFLPQLSLCCSEALVVTAVLGMLRRKPAGFLGSLAAGLRRFGRVLKVALALFALQVVFTVLVGLIVATLQFGQVTRLTLFFVSVYPWVYVPVALLLARFWVAAPAAVLDAEPGPLQRSTGLTRGNFFRICAVLLLIEAIDLGSRRFMHATISDFPRFSGSILGWTREVVMVSLAAVFAAVGYHALRLAHEGDGADASELKEVFR